MEMWNDIACLMVLMYATNNDGVSEESAGEDNCGEWMLTITGIDR
jgi:hypothetical protein